MWALAYYVAGIISLEFDDPVSQVAVVWFPAGVAVSAFLISQRSRWPLLLAVLLTTRIFLDFQWRHDLASTLVHSCLALSTAICIAWLVRRFARRNDYLHAIVLWIISTVCVCAMEAALPATWLSVTSDVPLQPLLWVTWIANITGVIFTTIAIMSLLHEDLNVCSSGWLARLTGVTAFVLMCLSTWFIFGVNSPWLKSGITDSAGSAMNFALACIPIILCVVVSVTWPGRGATLALLTLATLVIHHTDNGQGPFFLKGLNPGEPLLLAQCYLCATALLIVFLRVLATSARRYDLDTGREAGEGVMYRLHPESGEIYWDDNLREVLGIDAPVLSTFNDVLERVHPKDQEKLRRHWSAQQRRQGGASLTFRITAQGSDTRVICDNTPGLMADSTGEVIVGNWQISHYK
jgi:integral membrane sensor domain MASE1